MKTLRKKQRHQVKSRFYYIFWGAATVSVFAGQMYVGSGYRQMSRSFNRIMDAIVVELVPPRGRAMPVPGWDDGELYHPTDPPMRVSPEYEKDFFERI